MSIIFAADELKDISAGYPEGVFIGRARASTINKTGDATYGAEQLLGGLILRDPNGAARTDTLPSASTMSAVVRAANTKGGFLPAFEFTIRNTADAAETITVAAGAGVTISGTATVTQNNSRQFLWIQTGDASATVYSLGASAH